MIDFMDEMSDEEKMKEITRLQEWMDGELQSMEPDELLYRYLRAKLGANADNTLMPFGSSLEVAQKIQDLLDAYSVKNN